MALDLIAELEAVIDSFERAGVDYALCGGLALAVYGHPRATMDIDLLVPPDRLSDALAAAKTAGFDIPGRKMVFGLADNAPREVHRVSKLDPETNELMSLDLIVVGPVLAPTWATRAVARWRDREFSIVSREGLVTMKRLAGRLQDLADVAALEGSDDDET